MFRSLRLLALVRVAGVVDQRVRRLDVLMNEALPVSLTKR